MDIEKLKDVMTKSVMVVAYRAGDVSTEDGSYATTGTDEIIRLEQSLCEALGTEHDDIHLYEALGLIDSLRDYKSERDEALEKLATVESQTPVAWMHNSREIDVISTVIKDLVHKSFTAHGFYSKVERAPVDKSENYTIPLYAKPVPAEKPAVSVSIHDELLFVGYTNGSQIVYAKESEGAFYKDTDNGCIIPLYMLCAHEHSLIGTPLTHSEEIPLPEGCKPCFECDGSCYDRCPSHESEGE